MTKPYLINLVRQKLTVTGGTSRCDLPGYYHWLQRNPKMRQAELTEWLTPLEPLRKAVELNLYLIRNNANVSQETAVTGVFQSKLEAQGNYQMIQVGLPPEHPCFPEISGGKQRFTIRFWKIPATDIRPVPAEQDVNFELSCCML
jgi:cell division protein ZapD